MMQIQAWLESMGFYPKEADDSCNKYEYNIPREVFWEKYFW